MVTAEASLKRQVLVRKGDVLGPLWRQVPQASLSVMAEIELVINWKVYLFCKTSGPVAYPVPGCITG